MAMDVIPVIYQHLQVLPDRVVPQLDLFLHSNGGDGVVPWRLVTLLRERCERLTVLVPDRAFSAATLTALGADEVLMHEMGMLGPIDPTITTPFNPPDPRAPGRHLGISVEDVSSYIALVKEDVGITHEDELVQAFLALASGSVVHPLALGTVKRTTSQSRMLGERLLKSRQAKDLAPHEIGDLISSLTSQLFYHGHPISRREAREDVGLTFVHDPDPRIADLMWELFQHYSEEMQLGRTFQPIAEFEARGAMPSLPGATNPPSVGTLRIEPVNTVLVESEKFLDAYEMELELTAVKEWNGNVQASVAVIREGWRRMR